MFIPSLSYAAHFSQADEHRDQSLTFYQRGNFEQAILIGMKAARLYSQEGKHKEQVEALIYLARFYQSLGQYKTSLKEMETALP